jgi:hypothetical protein
LEKQQLQTRQQHYQLQRQQAVTTATTTTATTTTTPATTATAITQHGSKRGGDLLYIVLNLFSAWGIGE